MTAEQLKDFENCIIKVKVNENKEVPYPYGTFIAYLRYDKILKHYFLNHPYDINKKTVNCGEANFDYADIEFVKYATKTEAMKWYNEYQQFHKEVIMTKGFDSCKVELNMQF